MKGIAMKSYADLKKFLKEIVPLLIEKHMVSANALKVCSGISPDFVFYAREQGFEAFVKKVPGHVKNIVLTSDGAVEVDLSYIQFEFCPKFNQNDEEPERTELERLLDKVKKDPFSAIKIRLNDDATINKNDPSLEVPNFDSWLFKPTSIDDMKKFYSVGGVLHHSRKKKSLSVQECFFKNLSFEKCLTNMSDDIDSLLRQLRKK